jgi:hypothetical protein
VARSAFRNATREVSPAMMETSVEAPASIGVFERKSGLVNRVGENALSNGAGRVSVAHRHNVGEVVVVIKIAVELAGKLGGLGAEG